MANKIVSPEYYPLTQSQQHIAVSEMLYPETGINNICVSYFLPTEGNPDYLAQAINHVLGSTQAMSLRITMRNQQPCQYIHTFVPQYWDRLDFSADHGDLRESKWQTEMARTHLTFLDSPLYYAAIYQSNRQKLGFLLKTHHIISDAWTHQILAQRIMESYHELTLGLPLTAYAETPFLTMLDTEQEYVASDQCQRHRSFWREQLFPLPPPLGIIAPERRISPQAQRIEHYFTAAESQKIDDHCQKTGIGPANFFLLGLAMLLFRVYRKSDFLLGILTHNRLGKQEKAMTGMFVNTVPLRLRITAASQTDQLADHIKLEMTKLLRNQRFPLGMMRNLSPEAHHLFTRIEVMYTYENVEPNMDLALHFCGYENYPLLIRPSRRTPEAPYKIEIDYRNEAFTAQEIANLKESYLCLLQQILDKPVQSVKEIPWFSDLIRDRVLHQFNQTAVDYPYNATIQSIFEARVRSQPDAKAVSDDHETVSYAELNQRANRLARVLRTMGAGRDIPVAVLLERSTGLMVTLLAILKSGSAYLPISTDLPVKRIDGMLVDSEAALLISLRRYTANIAWSGRVLLLDELDYSLESPADLDQVGDSRSLAYIIYTSGSTGKPKGAMIEHRSVLNRLFWMVDTYPLTSKDVILQKTPYTFDVSVWELFAWFFVGAQLHFLTPGGEKEPDAILRAIGKCKISTIHFVPSMLAVFLEYLERGASLEKLANLKTVTCSGEALPARQVKLFTNLVTDRFGTKLYNLYGPTEATVDVSFHDCTNDRSALISIGKPIANVQLLILDENQQLLPPGIPGELLIGGVCLARGYLKRPELDAQKFIAHPYASGERLYRTGDLAAWNEDGSIQYLGRLDHQVKIRGNRVEIGEIEAMLLAIDDMREAVVVALTDQDGNSYLAAYFVADRIIDHQSLRQLLKAELPTYMIPSFFQQMPHFPLNVSGKLDRSALPRPDQSGLSGRQFLAPRDAREEEICAIWENVLNVEGIGVRDNFFDIGGDSLRLIQVLGALKCHYELSLQDLFDFQTIETLSQHIHDASARSWHLPPATIVNPPTENHPDQVNQLEKLWNYQQECYRAPTSTPILTPTAHLLLTGGTGFLGCYLIREILEQTNVRLTLLLRGASDSEAAQRLAGRLAFYFGPQFFDHSQHRIKVVAGDLLLGKFGLTDGRWESISQEIDTVIHAAADVRHYGRLEDFQAINVAGTHRVIEFCNQGRPKVLHYMSTASIGLATARTDTISVFTEDDSPEHLASSNVYLQTKIEAEQLLRNNLPTARIYRLGNLVFDSQTGQFQPNSDGNAFWQSLRCFRRLGAMPAIPERFVDFSFIDQTATALRILIFDANTAAGTYHVFSPIRYNLPELAELANLRCIKTPEFITRLNTNDPVFIHAPYLQNPEILHVLIYNVKTLAILQRSGFNWNKLDKTHLEIMFEQDRNTQSLCEGHQPLLISKEVL